MVNNLWKEMNIISAAICMSAFCELRSLGAPAKINFYLRYYYNTIS